MPTATDINRSLEEIKNKTLGLQTGLSQFQGQDVNTMAPDLNKVLTQMGTESQTIATKYAERQRLTQEAAEAQKSLITSKAETAIGAEKEAGAGTLETTRETMRGLGPASTRALIIMEEGRTSKRVRELETTRDELLAQNKATEASRLDDLILKEQEATTLARTNYLNTVFATSAELRAQAGFETPTQQAQRALKTASQTAIANLAVNAPDAGITQQDIELGDIAAITEKYRNSAVYKQNIAKGEADIARIKAETAKITGETSGTGVYVPGQNPTIDSWINRINNGVAKLSDITGTGAANIKNKVIQGLDSIAGKISDVGLTDLQTSAYMTAKDVLDKFNKGGSVIVGTTKWLSPFGWTFLPGIRQDFINKYKTLIAQLALDNVKYLKGQGQISDSERKILSEASTALNINSSDKEFKKILQGIIDTFESVGKKNLEERAGTRNRSLGTQSNTNLVNPMLSGSQYKGFILPN